MKVYLVKQKKILRVAHIRKMSTVETFLKLSSESLGIFFL